MRLRFWILIIAAFIPAGCKTEIRAGGIGGNVSPLDPDVVYFPAPIQDVSHTSPSNPQDTQRHESGSKPDYSTDQKRLSEQ